MSLIMKKLQDIFNQTKQAVRDFVSSRSRVAVLLAVIAAVVGALLLLPPPSSEPQLDVQTIQSDAGASVATDPDASVVIDLLTPAGSLDAAADCPDGQVEQDLLTAAEADAATSETTCSQ